MMDFNDFDRLKLDVSMVKETVVNNDIESNVKETMSLFNIYKVKANRNLYQGQTNKAE